MLEVEPVLEIEDAISPDLRLGFGICTETIAIMGNFDFSEDPFFLGKKEAALVRDVLTKWLEEKARADDLHVAGM